MNRVPNADWAASTPWSGITGKPPWITPTGPSVDLSNVTWNGTAAGRYPFWNGTRFIPVVISAQPSTSIRVVDQPAIAVRRRPPGNPASEFENVWARYEANVQLFGATGNGGTADSDAVNAAIQSINSEGGGCLYFPSGSYNLSAGVDQITVPCLVRGDGIGVSSLDFGGGDGLWFSFGTSASWAGFSDISINSSYTGIRADGAKVAFWSFGVECESRGVELSECLGGWIYNGSFLSSGTAISVYGDASDLEVSGLRLMADLPWETGVYLSSGTANLIRDSFIPNCTSYAVYLGTSVVDSRVHNILLRDIQSDPIVFDGGLNNYINELFGLGGNTDTRFDSRKEIISVFPWNPGSTGPGFGWYDDFSVPGAALGDQVIHGVPYTLDPAVSVDSRVIAADTARISIINFGTASVDPGLGDWKLRIFN